MPGKTTFYSRIKVMLELAAAKQPTDSQEFLAGIEANSPPNFVYYRWDTKKNQRRDICSRKSIDNTFELAVELGLLDKKTGKLTPDGKIAVNPTKFEKLIIDNLCKSFEKCGFSVELIKKESKKMLRGDPVVLPTADELYNRLARKKEIKMTPAKFRTLLRLLAACGGIRINRRQIFLPGDMP